MKDIRDILKKLEAGNSNEEDFVEVNVHGKRYLIQSATLDLLISDGNIIEVIEYYFSKYYGGKLDTRL